MSIEKGDKCWVYIGAVTKHYGVCIGHDAQGTPRFIHNTARHGKVTYATLAEFSGGKPVHVELRAMPGRADEVVRRAEQHLGTAYNLITFNCEHLANLATTGEATSWQVKAAGGIFGFLAVVGGLALANNNGTSIGSDGYRRDGSGRFATRRWW